MTVLVTGGAGYIGSHMAYALVDAGEDVVILDDLSTGSRGAVPADLPFIRGNVGDSDLVSKVIAQNGVNAVIHFAGSIVVSESVEKPLTYYQNNTAASRTLIECAVKEGVRHLIFSSTAAVYGDAADQPVSERSPTVPVSPYGWSKLMTEIILRDVDHAHGLRSVALRYFNVAGADPELRTGQSSSNATHLIKVACQAAIGARPGLAIFGTDYPTRDGTCIRDYIHVSDLVGAHLEALRYLRNGGATTALNCGYGHGFSVLEVIDVVKKIAKVDFEVANAPRRGGDPPQIVADCSAIHRVLSWKPRFDNLPTIVSHALAWEKKLSRIREGSSRSVST